jgi:putative phosphoribosyl transferase
MIFKSRESAARQLTERLQGYKHKQVIVAGIPRGAIPMAKIIADDLGAELSAVLVHKISAPFNVELAVGSVGLSGHIHTLPFAAHYGIPFSYIETEAQEQMLALKIRQRKYGLREPDYKGRTVIIVDDGIATGATTISAIHEVRSFSPQKIILATPVSSDEAAEELNGLVDEFVCLYIPEVMFSIGEFYESFPQVSDEEVISLLHHSDRNYDRL